MNGGYSMHQCQIQMQCCGYAGCVLANWATGTPQVRETHTFRLVDQVRAES